MRGIRDAPKLPYHFVAAILERIGEFDWEITARVVFCGAFLVLARGLVDREDLGA